MAPPISVDPTALAGIGTTVGGEGDAIAAAVGALDAALSGSDAMFGHDAAGLAFSQGYTSSGKSVLDAAASAVNAGRRVGFGIETSAANYGHANASSTVGGGTSAVPVPTAPATFGAPAMPAPLGSGIAAPLGWALVESFVGDVWPDGNPGELRAAAGAWRTFGTAITGVANQIAALGPSLSAQHIPEAGQMAFAMGKISWGLTKIAADANKLAASVDGFAGTVEATQNAVRNLLHQLSPSGVLETIGGIFTGHNPLDEIRKIADEIKTVLNNMKREADAYTTLFNQAINELDSATSSLEAWANKEFTSALGHDVGGALSFVFDAGLDELEGATKFVAETVHGIGELDPTRFLYDPSGAAKTWEGLGEVAAVVTNPALLAQKIASDPEGSLNTVKDVFDWKDVEAGHPFRALGYDAAQVGSLLIPGAGEADAAADGAGIAGRTASAEERAAAAATRDAVPGVGVASAESESIASQAGRVGSELDGIKVPESSTPGAAPGGSAPAGRPPVDASAPAPNAPGRAPVDTAPPADTPRPTEPPAAQPLSPSPSDSAPPHVAESQAPAPSDSTVTHDAGPEATHADPPPPPSSHVSEPVQIDSPPPPSSHVSEPAQIAESDPSLLSGDVGGSRMITPEPPQAEAASGTPHGAFDHQGAGGDTRPVWSDHGHSGSADASHDPGASHDSHQDPDGVHGRSFEEGAGPDGRIKFSGHGSYSAADGEFVIPEGSSVTVYAEHGSTITDSLGNLIETGGDTSRVYSHTYQSGEAIPNYTLHPPDDLNIQGNPWTVDASSRLSELLQANMGEIDFAACLYDPGAPTNLVYDAHGVWNESTGQLTHVYESQEPSGAWDDDISDVVDTGGHSEPQPYYDANQNAFKDAPSWDYSDIDFDEF